MVGFMGDSFGCWVDVPSCGVERTCAPLSLGAGDGGVPWGGVYGVMPTPTCTSWARCFL